MVGYREQLDRRIRETESTGYMIGKRSCLIILLFTIIDHWNVSVREHPRIMLSEC